MNIYENITFELHAWHETIVQYLLLSIQVLIIQRQAPSALLALLVVTLI